VRPAASQWRVGACRFAPLFDVGTSIDAGRRGAPLPRSPRTHVLCQAQKPSMYTASVIVPTRHPLDRSGFFCLYELTTQRPVHRRIGADFKPFPRKKARHRRTIPGFIGSLALVLDELLVLERPRKGIGDSLEVGRRPLFVVGALHLRYKQDVVF
jgi:hypothetical protein